MLTARSKSKPTARSPLRCSKNTSNGKAHVTGLANGKVQVSAEDHEEIPEAQLPTFITVHYGNNQSAIINTSCKSRALLDHIRRKCKCSKSVNLDLVDLEGRMKNLYKSQARDYSKNSEVLGRSEYVLVKVEPLFHVGPMKYTPLLQNTCQMYPKINERLDELNRESEAQAAILREQEQARMKENAKAAWGTIQASIKNTERKKSVVRALRNGRGSRSSMPAERRRSVDVKTTDPKLRKATH